MGMAQLVVAAVLVEGRSKSEVARQYGVSRRWVITLVQRYLAEGEAGLEPRSRRPLRSPRRTPVEVEDEIVEIRKDLDRGGHEAGAATIAFHLDQRHGHRAGGLDDLADPDRPRVRHPPAAQAAQEQLCPVRRRAAQRALAADITHWALADGTDVEILNLLDDHSRLVSGQRRPAGVQSRRRRRLLPATPPPTTGIPPAVLTDNGAVFTGRSRGGGRVALELTLHTRGIRFRHSRPYHPQTCGKVERFHQTLKKWLTQPTPGPHPRPAASPARHLPRLLQHRPPPPRPRPAHPSRGLRRPAQSRPHRHPARRRPLPRPPRHRRPQRQSSPCATTAGSTTSASAAATPAPTSSSSSTTSTSASSPTTANSSANSSSTPAATTNHSPNRERCPETPVHGVPRHRTSAPGRIRTCNLC